MSGIGSVLRCAGSRKLWPSLFVARQDGTPLRANAARMCGGVLSEMETKAVAALKDKGIEFTLSKVVYEKQENESLCESFARQCGVHANDVVKTMVFKYGAAAPCIVLMHGDRAVCAKKLAALLGVGVKKVKPADEETAQKFTGYQFGGTSPFALKQGGLAIYMERSIEEREMVLVNAGSRSLVVRLKTRDLVSIVQPTCVNVAKELKDKRTDAATPLS